MEPLLRVDHIYKSFMGNTVLNDISISLAPGECMALVGENGAGKSTLMKILSGIYRMDSGDIRIRGESVDIASPKRAQQLGVSIIHQELNVIPNLTVAQNIFLGRELGSAARLDDRTMAREVEELLGRIGVALSSTALVGELSVAEQQVVEIAKVLSQNAEIIIMDEPTTALTIEETERLFDIIDGLKRAGKGIIYISHRMEEIFRVAGRICVLRDGRLVGTFTPEDAVADVVERMVGKKIDDYYPKHKNAPGEVIMSVRGLGDGRHFHDVGFDLRAGEVLGITGLMGAGQMALARGIYGLARNRVGELTLNGRSVRTSTPAVSVALGLGMVSPNRKDEGLVLAMSIRENIGLSPWAPVQYRGGVINEAKERRISEESVARYKIKTESINKEVMLLSGGNQQKVLLAKVFAADPDIVLMCEPTRGVDVNGNVDIYNIINELLKARKGVLLVSSEIPEVLGMSDRILVMYKGRVAKEMANVSVTQEDVMFYATGGHKHG